MNFGRLSIGIEVTKLVGNELFGLLDVNVSDEVQEDIVGSVMRAMPGTNVFRLPRANQGFLANGKALGETILPVQGRENLTLDPILNGVDHGHFGEDRRSFLLQPRRLDPGFHDIDEGIEGHGQHGNVAPWRLHRTGRIKDRVMKVGVGIGLRSSPKQALSFARAHVGHVLGEMGDSLLRL